MIATVQSLPSHVNRDDPVYQANERAMQEALDRLRGELLRSTQGGGEKYVQRHLARGKLLPRERVEMQIGRASCRERV